LEKIKNTSVPVLILGVQNDHGVDIARSLGRWGVDVHGIGSNPRSPSLASRYLQQTFQWDIAQHSNSDSVSFLCDVAEKLGGRPLLVPTFDDGVIFVARNAAALKVHFLFPEQSLETVTTFCNKQELFHLAKKLGAPTAESMFPLCEEDVRRFIEQARFPVLLKGIDGARLERRCGLKKILLWDSDELLRRYREVEDPSSPNLMLQEYIPGGEEAMWLFNGYFDEHSRCWAAFTGRKLRQAPIDTGSGSFCECVWNQDIADLAIALAEEMGYAGILDIDYRYDSRDGTYKLLDPNPRVGEIYRLFVSAEGLDVVQMFYLHMTGQPLPDSTQQEGRTWVSEDKDLIAAILYRLKGRLRLRDWLRSIRGVNEKRWIVRDDLRPCLHVALRLASVLIGGVLKRLGLRRNRATE
jgi:predicted ATP-grasp superfamily ATP-dependent carboligase